MPQLLLEFFSEEIPARMQPRAEADLERLLIDKLSAAGLLPEGIKAFVGPRRLAAVIEGLPLEQAAQIEEKKGPRVGAPEAALQGFVKSAGLASLAEAEIIEDKKGAFFLARVQRAGRPVHDIIAQIVPDIVRGFPWPKSMRWGSGDLTWVRPLHSILCAFDGELVPFEIEGIASGLITRGHRFHAPQALEVRDFDAYRDLLKAARVLIRREDRQNHIRAEALSLCAARELELIEDEGLLTEVAGLCEWPVPLIGEMDPAFLELPAEVIRLTMRTHQRYFALFDPKRGGLSPHFLAVANIEAKDGGAAIAAGNARVLSARLSDARFFWEADKARPLDSLLPKLDRIIFHEKLGSVGDKARRVEKLALELAQQICPKDAALVRTAARLCKADLVSDTVGEFPELQGQVGGWLHLLQGGEAREAQAIEEHYRPIGPNDRVPTDPIGICVALADKLDTLCGFFAIDERPTGSKDPFALRRAALGVVRIILENGLRLELWPICRAALEAVVEGAQLRGVGLLELHPRLEPAGDRFVSMVCAELIFYFRERLTVQQREQDRRHDHLEAVFESQTADSDLVRVIARVAALSAFLTSQNGANLLAGYRRAASIVDSSAIDGEPVDERHEVHPDLFTMELERDLHEALQACQVDWSAAWEAERFTTALAALADLRAPVDAFLNGVFVNHEDEAVRANRLILLAKVKDLMEKTANFSKIEG